MRRIPDRSTEQTLMRGHKVEQLGIATVSFFWCFLMWFSTAAFSPSIAATYLVVAAWYLWRGSAAKTMERRDAVQCGGDLRGMMFVWTRYIAIALMLAYAMSFGLEIALNAWLPTYFARGFHDEILTLGFTGVAGIQIAAGTFAAVVSFNASLFRPFAGFMSDLFQRKGWTPLPFVAKELPCAPRLHWLGIALILIMLSMIGLTVAGLYGFLPLSIAVLVALGISVSFGTGGTFALVPLLFPDRPGIAAGFIGGVSTIGGIAYPLIFASVNAHVGYLYVALYMFAPFILFYFWAARYERHPQEHGLLGRALIGQRF
jgi:MFS transporter, NNP family, nitrate/nitrite transporter